jgi:hypothetical protein
MCLSSVPYVNNLFGLVLKGNVECIQRVFYELFYKI